MYKVGIIGSAGYISGVYIEALNLLEQQHSDLKLVCGVDIKNPGFDLKTGLRVYSSMEEMQTRCPEVNAVCILTPPETHLGLAKQAAQLGMNVLVEKPPALSYDECQEMVQEFEAGTATLFLAWHAQYAAGVEELMQRSWGQTLESFSIQYEENVKDYRLAGELKDFSPGALWDSGINAIAVMTKLWGTDPLSVENARLYVSSRGGYDVGSYVAFSKGALRQEWLSSQKQRVLQMNTTDGTSYKLDIHKGELFVDGQKVCCEKQAHTMLGEYTRQCEHWLRCMRQGQSYLSIEPVQVIEDIFANSELVERRAAA